MSNKGLNSNEALEESTATNSSVTLSGIRREKEAMIALGIKDYTTDAGKRQKIEDPNSRHCLGCFPHRSTAKHSAQVAIPTHRPYRGYPQPLTPEQIDLISRQLDERCRDVED